MFFDLLDRSWPGELDPDDVPSYKAMLADTDPQAVVAAIRQLSYAGAARWRPKPPEILATLRRDPARPTFEEAYQLIYGPGGVLRSRPAVRRYADESERRRLYDEAAIARAEELGPGLLAGFVVRQGLERLRHLPVGAMSDGDGAGEGHWARKELREAWERHVAASDGRELAVLASGGRLGLRQLDPLAALGGHAMPAPALPAGTPEEEGPHDDH